MVMREGRLYSKRPNSAKVDCMVCERKCIIGPGMTGICGNYVNLNGRLYSVGYGRLSAFESRPIEIKPLYHYWPNSTALTFSSWGCNFYCPWCQNHRLSFTHPRLEDPVIEPDHLVELAVASGDEGLSASFNEPTVNYEYLLDVAQVARGSGLYLSIVTNGYQSLNSLTELVEAGFDGWCVDVKGCPGMKKALVSIDHSKVFRNARKILDMGGHVEMVYLVVTNTNCYEECFKWIINTHLSELGPETPLHINRYYPAHKWRERRTPLEELLNIYAESLREGIEYVYVGNLGDPDLETTRCPKCSKTLIQRQNYRVKSFNLSSEGGHYRCPRCGNKIPIRGRYVT